MKSPTAEALIEEMQRRERSGCEACGAVLCSHQILMNIVMGFRECLHCVPCMALALGHRVDELRDLLINYLQQKECHQNAWQWADQNEGCLAREPRLCLEFPERQDSAVPSNARARGESESPSSPATSEWDAGDMGCGDLVLELRRRLLSMQSGDVIKVCAQDPGAPEDLPAWCRLTGHVLLRAEHPTYWIERKK